MKFVRKGVNTWLLAIVGLFTVAAVAIACGDGDTTTMEPDPDPTPAPMPDPSPTPNPGGNGGVLRIGIPDDVTTYNPWDVIGPGSTAYNFAVFLNRYSSVMKLSDQKYQWIPSLAADYPTDLVREGDFWVTEVDLRQDITWSDGESLDAEDVAFSVNTPLKLELTGNWTQTIDPNFLDRAEAVSDYRVKYYFKATDEDGEPQTPGLAVWQYGASQAAILPEHYWAPKVDALGECGADDTECGQNRREALYAIDAADEPILGPASLAQRESGAFIALDSDRDSYIASSSVTNYADGTVEETVEGVTNRWLEGTDPGSATEVDLQVSRDVEQDRTIYNVYNSQDTAILALRDDEIDYFLSPLGLSAGLRSQVESAEGVQIFENPSNGFRYLAFNFDREPFNDQAFRQAVAVLIDRDLLESRILQGAVSAIYTPVPQGNAFWYNPDVPQFGRKMNADGSVSLNDDGEPETLSREDRITEAIRILKAAGYTWEREPVWDPDNLRVVAGRGLNGPDGNPIEQREVLRADGSTEVIDEPFELLSPGNGYDPLRATSAIWIERWLSDAGIPVRANLTGFNEIVDKVFNGTVTDGPNSGDALRNFDMWILGWGLTPYPDHLVTFFTEANAGAEGFNAGGFINQEYEDLASQFSQATEVEKARELAFEMQRVLAEQLPYITLFSTPIVEAYRPANVSFAYTEVLDGVQNLFQSLDGPLSNVSTQ